VVQINLQSPVIKLLAAEPALRQQGRTPSPQKQIDIWLHFCNGKTTDF